MRVMSDKMKILFAYIKKNVILQLQNLTLFGFRVVERSKWEDKRRSDQEAALSFTIPLSIITFSCR